MRIDYTNVIEENEDELIALEKRLRGQRTAVRVRMLRLLKTGQVRSLRACAPLLGYSLGQLNRWWKRYREGGVSDLLEEKPRPGKPSQLTEEAWQGLQVEIEAGRIQRLEDARTYLKEKWSIEYKSLNGIWWIFKKFRVKWKKSQKAL